ncbi:hypothetical protein GGE46_005441 [Rhizobium etli]|uniref:Uncharacterized protein n=1 Tax=Rhizobium etli TaxID=29449 RepID=A0A7W7EHF1_RHIET|nr:hypothetical protein [Rhizobium etli]MBB4538654.1 hypothetical protein [Rhizobium etli]
MGDIAFEVELAKSGKTLFAPAEKTLTQVLEDHG